jgi:hypothetical protein
MRKAFQFLAALAAVCVPFSANADILWDQQANSGGSNFIDQQFSDFPTFSTYIVNDATFGSAVTVTDVTVYLTTGSNNPNWPGLTSGVLNIFDGNALVASDDPTTGGDFGPGAVSVSYTNLGGGVAALKASGLNINLAAGNYWFGLTANAAFGTFGQEFHWQAASNLGANSFARNPGGAFGFPAGTNWFDIGPVAGFGDAAFKVEGSAVPEPSTLGVLIVGLAGMAFRRRR